MFNLSRKISLITGAAQGIGKSIALEFSKLGSQVIIGDIDVEKSKEVLDIILQNHGKGMIIKLDVTSFLEIKEQVAEVIEKVGPIDILVNNAGILHDAFITEIEDEQWDHVLAVNLKGAFNCSKAVIPYMIQKGKGKIVNISSIGGKDGFPLAGVHYSASKAGMLGLTRQMAKQVAQYNINVNAIAPGTANTGMIKHRTLSEREKITSAVPLGRLAEPEDIAYVAAFLASNDSDFITGETIDVCGGLYMQ